MADGDRDLPGDPEALRARLTERLTRLRGELESLRFETARRCDELVSRLAEEPGQIVSEVLARGDPARRGGGAAAWAESARRLDRAGNQIDALTRFLEECLRHASRAVLFVERGGRLGAWKSVGFERPPESRAGEGALAGAAVARVLDGFPVALAPGNDVSRTLDASDAARAVLVPFVVREKVAGAVYADGAAGADGRLDPDAIAMLAYLAGLVVDRLSKRKLVPSPPLRPFEGWAEPAPETPGPGNGRSLAGPLAPAQGTEERREEARRFARLLASEIKLYNEPAVLEGLVHGDLYSRLRDDIDRGRSLYEQRVPEDVRAGADYYYEELVEVLAGGVPRLMGHS